AISDAFTLPFYLALSKNANGRNFRRVAAPDHPHQRPSEKVASDLLAPLSDPDFRPDAERERVTLLLPTVGGTPIPSPELLFERAEASTLPPRLAPWSIHAHLEHGETELFRDVRGRGRDAQFLP
ncbi:MAG: hypothetical protein ACRD1Z_12325, partial [Vicinamibacteria bacterium]